MTRLIEFVIALALVLALFVVIGLVLPSKRHLVESVETNRKMSIVFDTLNNVRRLKDWNPLIPAGEMSYAGGDASHAGQGARVEYNSESWGKGSWEIVESEQPASQDQPGKVAYAIKDDRTGKNKHSVFSLEPTGKNNRNVKITQTYDIDYGWDLMGRYSGMYVSRQVGDLMKAGLSKLTTLLAGVPNYDYRLEGSNLTGLKVVDVPAENVLFVNAGNIDRTNDAIKASIKANAEWIHRVMDANNLEAAGPLRIITTDFGAEKYAFDVAMLVRKKSGDAKKDDDKKADADKADGDDADKAEPVNTDVAEVYAGELSVKIPDGAPVEYIHIPAHKAANAQYTGFMAGLDVVRNSLRAWATTNGYEVTDRPYEVWKKGVDGSFEEDGEFDVYWSVKQ
ncbi:SRPBCC family protein [Pseudoxanthomonas dokdonensis]|uniref:Polyketide cyclase n=1 Tax=Pseudoxanthomonas dokdonensis TaxID=344882 RepID=A0A0R0CIT6_9GAMM|nr:SRPBCC family protein [Pseudoxanthomonas dokdonensis]KRG69821.1 polyketide cyclase [Pseudoxanthomonas dokdonensis]